MVPSAPARAQRPERPASSASGPLPGLANRFVELLSRKLTRIEFAVEMARLVADAVKGRAVAVLGYDARQGRLELLGEQGLTEAARASFGASESGWDIPLRGLRNRRISVITSAHQNPFVPRALISLSAAGLSIASLPIYADYEPAGVLLLFAAGKSAFPDAQLQTLSQALRICARGLLDTAGAGVRARGRTEEAQAVIAKLIAEGAIIDPAEAAAAQDDSSAAGVVAGQHAEPRPDLLLRIEGLESALAKVRQELERSAQTVRSLTASGNALARERDALVQQVADLEGARETVGAELRAELTAMQERLLAIDSERARHQRMAEARRLTAQQAVATLESERETLLDQVQIAQANAAELQAAVSALQAQRDGLTAQVGSLTSELRGTVAAFEQAQARYAQERAEVEADRDAWKEQSATIRAQLSQRTTTLAELERELRGTVVARDAATAQLDAARAELERLAVQGEELGQSATQVEAARASAVAETVAVRRTLEAERTRHQQTESGLRADLAALRDEADRTAATTQNMRAELTAQAQAIAERDTHVAELRRERDTSREGEATWQERAATVHAELATSQAQLEQTSTDRRQLLAERDGLRASLAEARQHANQAEVAHAAIVGDLQTQLAELHRQVDAFTADRNTLTDDLRGAQEEQRRVARTLNVTQRRNDELSELLRARDAAIESGGVERAQLATQLASLSGQLHASQETLQRGAERHNQERAALEADRDGWKEQAVAARAELTQRGEAVTALEQDLHAAAAARDAAAVELETEREARDHLAALTEELRHAAARLEGERDNLSTENGSLRHALDDERAGRLAVEQTLRADLSTQRSEAERLGAIVTGLRSDVTERTQALTDRDARLAALRAEIDALRQQSTDRGVLAQQATALGSKVVELEQALAAVRGEAARAERHRAALAEKLEAAHRRETDAAASASRELASLQDALQQLSAERDRLASERAASVGEMDGMRATLAAAQTTMERLRTERTELGQQAEVAAGRVADAERRLEERAELLRQRDIAATTAGTERQHLAAQLDTLRKELRAGQDAFETMQTRFEREQQAIEADREQWKSQASAARADADRLTALIDDLRRTISQLETGRGTAQKDKAALEQLLEQERTATAQKVRALQERLATTQADAARWSAACAARDDAVAERDEQLVALRQQEAAARAAQAELEHTTTALRADIAQLMARLDERTTECQQLAERRAALEQQIELIATTQGEETQALAGGLQAARAEVAELEHERAALQAALAATRQELREASDAQTSAVTALQTDAAELRKQLKTATAGRTALTKRMERAEADLATHNARADEASRRAEAAVGEAARLERALAALQAHGAAVEGELAQARGDAATVAAQLQESVASYQQLRQQQAALDGDLTAARAAHAAQQQTDAQALQALQKQVARLEQERTEQHTAVDELHRRLEQTEAAHATSLNAAATDAGELRTQVETLQAARAELLGRLAQTEAALNAQAEQRALEQRHALALAEQLAQREASAKTAESQRSTRDNELGQARAEIEALRQQSEDRGVLARQASELGGKVVALEQQLAAIRGEAAQTERQRALLLEELAGARAQQAQAEALAQREQAALRDELQRLADNQRALENAAAEHVAQLEGQRVTFSELQRSLEEARDDRTRLETDGTTAAQRLADTNRRVEELTAALRQRDAALETTTADRKRLSAQVTQLTKQLRAEHETIERVSGRSALDRTALETERDTWKEQAATSRAEQQRLATLAEELKAALIEIAAARTTLAAENAALHQSMEAAQAAQRQGEDARRAEGAALQADAERRAAEVEEWRAAVAERDAQLATQRHAQAAAEEGWQQTHAALNADLTVTTMRLEEAVAEMQRVRGEREALQHQLASSTATRGEEIQTLSHGLQAAREQIAALEHERGALRAALEDTRRQATDAATKHAQAAETLQADSKQLRQQLQSVTAARATLDERLQQADRMLAAQGEQLHGDQQRVTTLTERCAQLEQSLASTDTRRNTLDAELSRSHAEVEALRQQSADRGVLAHQATELGTRVQDLEEQLAALRGEAARGERQRAALAEELETARRQQAQAIAATERQQATERATIQRLTDERTKLTAENAAHRAQMEAQRTTLADLRATVEALRAERLQAVEEGQDATQRLAEVQRHVLELGERLQQREAAVEAATGERRRLEDAIRAAEAASAELALERDDLRRTAETALAQLDDERAHRSEAGAAPRTDTTAGVDPAPRAVSGRDRQGRYTLPPESEAVADEDEPLVIERSAPLNAALDAGTETPDSAAEPAPATPPVPETAGEMVLLDLGARASDATTVLKHAGFEITCMAPAETVIDDLARRTLTCVMVNLAAGPAAWRALKALREHPNTQNVPILAYLMPPDAQKGFCFGRADFGVWPMEPARIAERLERLRPRLRRLLAVSADVDGMGKIREPLGKAGVATSVVLDGKQALEFATIVQPEAALLHLTPDCSGVARAIAGIRVDESTRHLPLMVLFDKAPNREEAFFALVARELASKGTFQFTNLPGEIAKLLA